MRSDRSEAEYDTGFAPYLPVWTFRTTLRISSLNNHGLSSNEHQEHGETQETTLKTNKKHYTLLIYKISI